MAAAFEQRPTGAGENVCLLRQFLGADLHNREMWHVRPLFSGGERTGVQSIVQLMHAVGTLGNPDENRGCDGDERFNIPEGDFEWLGLAADIFESLQR